MGGLSWATEISIVASIPSVSEGGTTGAFTITATPTPTAPLDVQLTLTGTAQLGVDFSASPTSPILVTIPAGSSSSPITITPIQDLNAELDETVTLTVNAVSGLYTASASAGAATVTITDDEPVLTVAKVSDTIEGGSTPGKFRITNTKPVGRGINVSYTLAGTTVASDYTVMPSATPLLVTLPSNGSTVDVDITAIDDTISEPTETVTITLVASGLLYQLGASATASLNIADNEPVITVAKIADAAEPTTVGRFRFTSSAAFAANVTIPFVVGGTAVAGTDYSAFGTSTVLPLGQTSVDVTFTPVEDLIAQDQRTVSVTVTATSNYTVGTPASSATANVIDDEPVLSIAALANAVEGGASGSFLITIATPVNRVIDVVYLMSGTATSAVDYTALSGTASLPANARSVPILISPVDDLEFEPIETVTATLGASTAYHRGANSAATLQIVDNEPTITVATIANAGEPGTNGTFRFSASPTPSQPVTIRYTIGGTATTPNDFTGLNGAVLLTSGQPYVDVIVAPVDDTAVEATETITVTLASDPAYQIGANSTASMSLTDDEISVSVAAIRNAVEGGQSGLFRITPSVPINRPLDITYTLAGTASTMPGVDYAGLSGTVRLAALATSVDVEVLPVDDVTAEPLETVSMTLVNNGLYNLGTSTATLQITDNEPTLSVVATTNAAEPATNGQFTITCPTAPSNPVTVRFTMGGTATSGSDYVTLGSSVVLLAGSTSVAVGVVPIDDFVQEPTETMTLTLVADPAYTLAATGSTATVTLTDDEPTVTVSATTNAAEPATHGAFTISYPGTALTRAVVVAFTVSGTATSGADFVSLGTTVTIPTGSNSVLVPIAVLDDLLPEPPETISLTIQPGSGYAVSATSTATALITDNEPSVSVAVTAHAEEAGTVGRFTISIPSAINTDLTIAYALSGTATSADYAAVTGSVVIPAGATSAVVAIIALDDALVEGEETVIITLAANPVTYALVPQQFTATMTLADDTPTVNIAHVSDPAEPGTAGSFRISYARTALPRAIVVSLAMSGTAVAGVDYATPATAVTIPANASSVLLSITPIDDAVVDPSETIIATLVATDGYRIGTATATLTLADNDPSPPRIVNEPSDIIVGVGQAWSHTLVIEKGEAITSATMTAAIEDAPGGLAAPGWVSKGTFQAISPARVSLPLTGTPTGPGTVRFRIKIGDGNGFSYQDITLVVVGGSGNG